MIYLFFVFLFFFVHQKANYILNMHKFTLEQLVQSHTYLTEMQQNQNQYNHHKNHQDTYIDIFFFNKLSATF